jgi:hypothetical protein
MKWGIFTQCKLCTKPLFHPRLLGMGIELAGRKNTASISFHPQPPDESGQAPPAGDMAQFIRTTM